MDEELNQDQVTNEAPAPAEGSEPPKSARELAMEQVIASRKAAATKVDFFTLVRGED